MGPVAAWRNRWRLISPALASTVAAPAITRSATTAIAIKVQLSPLTGPMPPQIRHKPSSGEEGADTEVLVDTGDRLGEQGATETTSILSVGPFSGKGSVSVTRTLSSGD